jgi:hypothetical protein
MHGRLVQMGGGAINESACSWGAMFVQPTATVNVVSPSGSELAQVPLGKPAATGAQTAGQPICAIPFTAKNLPSERLYGVRVTGVSGTTWVKQAKASHVTIAIGPGM